MVIHPLGTMIDDMDDIFQDKQKHSSLDGNIRKSLMSAGVIF